MFASSVFRLWFTIDFLINYFLSESSIEIDIKSLLNRMIGYPWTKIDLNIRYTGDMKI